MGKLDEAKIGNLMVAVSTLKNAGILSEDEAEKANKMIREMSDRLANRIKRTLNKEGRRLRSTFLRNLAGDHPIRQILSEEILRTLSDKHWRILEFLFNNRDRICTLPEILAAGWGDPNTREGRFGPRLKEVRDRVAPYIEISAINKQGYQLHVNSKASK